MTAFERMSAHMRWLEEVGAPDSMPVTAGLVGEQPTVADFRKALAVAGWAMAYVGTEPVEHTSTDPALRCLARAVRDLSENAYA